jgi:site-specific DNA recombinase
LRLSRHGQVTLRARKGGRYRYYTRSTKARQREISCEGRSIRTEKLEGLVADHLEKRLTKPERLEEVLCSILTRRAEQAERRAVHLAARRGAGEAKRLYDAAKTARRVASRPRRPGRREHGGNPQAQSCSELARPRGFEPLFSP